MKELVSVIITTYNRELLLERALISVIEQTYKNIEIIVSDDCSDYDIKSQLNNISNKYGCKIVYRCNQVNSGACYTRNEAIKIAKGLYIAGLDDDDEFTPNRIEYLMNNYNNDYSFISSNTTVISKKKVKNLFNNKNDTTITHYDCLWENSVGTQVLVEKNKIISCGGFDLNLKSAQDADMWLTLLKRFGPALRVHESLYVLHTEHDAPRISTSKNKINGLKCFYLKHFNDMCESQQKYSDFKLAIWKNNNKFKFKFLFLLDFLSFKYLLNKIIFGKK